MTIEFFAFTMCIFIVLFTHWVGDFVLQTDEQAKKKSSDNKFLTAHVLRYTTALLIGFSLMNLVLVLNLGVSVTLSLILLLVFLNSIIHWITDYITSRKSSALWAEGKVHDFFVMIGIDQFIHTSLLVLSVFAMFASLGL